jgi:KUP system potassium uptake protein
MQSQTSAAADPRAFLVLCLAACGVVFGDIGTSPLYTWNEVIETGIVRGDADVLGVCSLLFWTLSLAITVKYVALVLRADNEGEGGTFALMGLLSPLQFRGRKTLLGLLVLGACLLYADGLITPSISVLSAVEGLAVAQPSLSPAIVPASIAILSGLFWAQYLGTARLGTAFGAIAVAWFVAIALLGSAQIAANPLILCALSPHHAIRFLLTHSPGELVEIFGAVVLAITGGEALFADLGHFGVRAIRTTWNTFVYPSLCLNYLGQGAFLLGHGQVKAGSVFFSIVPAVALYPMILLATLAAIIASQALISGAFSLTRSAAHLGLLPRMMVRHTSERVEGQIYLPAVNGLLWAGCCLLIIGFGSSSALAAAYGLAVMAVVVITTLSLAVIAREKWHWSRWKAGPIFGGFLLFDLAYLGANVIKIPQGAWFSLAIASSLYLVMWTWRDGRAKVAAAFRAIPRVPLADVVAAKAHMEELPRAMVFLVSDPVVSGEAPTPLLLLRFIDLYGALPRHITLFSVLQEAAVPRWTGERFDVLVCGNGVISVRMHVGYLEQPDVRAALLSLKRRKAIKIHATRWTIVVGREEIVLAQGSGRWKLIPTLFRFLMRISWKVHGWFGLEGDTGISEQAIPVRVSPTGVEVALAIRAELVKKEGPLFAA